MEEFKLNDKQRAFVDLYFANGLNGRDAYMAVYTNIKKPSTADANASRLLKNDKVKPYVEYKQALISDSLTAKAQEVAEFWTAMMRGEVNEETIVLQPSEIPGVMENVSMWKQASAKDRLKASENLGKMYGMTKERIEAEIVDRVVIIDDL